MTQELFDKNATCNLCGQEIADIYDAVVDHVEMYWLGSPTYFESHATPQVAARFAAASMH
jgi:hypothetical protein